MFNRGMMKNSLLTAIVEICLSLVALIVLLPLWLLISLFIKLESPGPIFYRQKRVGQQEKLFTIYKFRSMRVNTIPPLELGAVKHDHLLVTKMGYIIRRFKLDETPQILNVLKREMSIVGPRPCLPERLPTMTPHEKTRFSCLPGLTGWAEVNGNVELSFQEQVALDIWYVQHRSLWLDIKIILKTLFVVVVGSHKNESALKDAQAFYQKGFD